MFEGKRFLPDPGTPMRNTARIRRLWGPDEPVPLTLASLTAKSFTSEAVSRTTSTAMSGNRHRRHRQRQRDGQLELLHVPRRGRAALRAQPAMDAQILVLDHHAMRLGEFGRDEQRLLRILSGR